MTESPYVELRACSAFSFLRGAAMPEALAERGAALGYRALALSDRDGLYGAPRFYVAARDAGLRPLVGMEVGLEGRGLLLLLARDADGYRNLCRLATEGRARVPKGEAGLVRFEDLEAHAAGLTALGGGAEGVLTRAVRECAPDAAATLVGRLASLFGPRHLLADLQRHGDPAQERLNRSLLALAERHHLRFVATNGVRCLDPAQRPLLDALTCIRHKTTLDAAGTLLERNSERHLKAPGAMAERFADQPRLIATTIEVADECAFTLNALPYRFPDFPTPPGQSQMELLRQQVADGARIRYPNPSAAVQAQLERELSLIGKLGLSGYFLIVADLIRFCEAEGILGKGRGSAANSAVCYALNITTVEPVSQKLLFERFLSEERGEWPDIDLDLPSGDEREKVIQYVFSRYGRTRAAMCAEVITYRDRSAARELGKVLGFAPDQTDRLARQFAGFGFHDQRPWGEHASAAGVPPGGARVALWADLCAQIQDLPRHLSQHSGGMIICAGRLDEVVPLEPARMPNRTVIQWDKDDAESLGLIKIDLLGLGMLAALQEAQVLVPQHHDSRFDIAHLPPTDPAVYALCCAEQPDTIGVFQIESRAQIATLPRHKPRCFYDLVIEVGLIRPGPLVGKMVNPYLRRRAGREPVTYPHHSVQPVLERTLGFPIFQEQLLRVAMVVGGFTGGEAEGLRRAMTHKRAHQKMAVFEQRLTAGALKRGLSAEGAAECWSWFSGFAEYGFPESHAYAFAYWVYASAYLKAHYPAVFLTVLLNAQPMGFYSAATLVKDSQRHGVVVHPPEVNASGWQTRIEAGGAVRLGLRTVLGLGAKAGERFEAERLRAPFSSVADVAGRCGFRRSQLDQLAESGAFMSLGLTRRQALWEGRAALGSSGPLLSATAQKHRISREQPLREMAAPEATLADYRTLGLTTGPQLIALYRKQLERQRVVPAASVLSLPNRRWTRIAGLVITRQRPATAQGLLFITLEDETGQYNAVVMPDVFERYRTEALSASLLMIEGPLQNVDGVATVKAAHLTPFGAPEATPPSHDFR